ncbi:hypothetical protein AVEN_354-1 [Araneus ventricosus]|uniref:Major facilitator superfamily (MFS) profile domain-containing protein n=1 Tax=Araneus ventricosus TaxID=182803 RepID=A0A4Y2PWM6_ARAVE|nr:hypothetical protein AVEN_354-1 [Araneus ventricosus]
MVKHVQVSESSHLNNSEFSCPYPQISSKPIEGPTYQGEFDWDTKMQGYILGVCYGGYLFTQIPGGSLADAIGSKALLVACNFAIGLLTIITPFAAWWNVYAMLVVQLLRSALQGFVIPAMFRMITNWFPRNERGSLSTLVVCGYGVGVVVTGVINGWLCDVPNLGWPSAYYLWGKLLNFG